MSRYFHRTTARRAAKTLKCGFKDGTGTYLTDRVWSGVWISNVPLDSNEGAEGEALLAVDIAARYVSRYEWREEGKGYREFLVPAAVLNTKGKIHVLDDGRRRRTTEAEAVPVTEVLR